MLPPIGNSPVGPNAEKVIFSAKIVNQSAPARTAARPRFLELSDWDNRRITGCCPKATVGLIQQASGGKPKSCLNVTGAVSHSGIVTPTAANAVAGLAIPVSAAEPNVRQDREPNSRSRGSMPILSLAGSPSV
jgi:hypothetical protein